VFNRQSSLFAGVEQATIVGLVFGRIMAVTGRIWMLILAHAAFDLTALAIIYWDLESRVAHLVFKQATISAREEAHRTGVGFYASVFSPLASGATVSFGLAY
jgi:hypothetical protein